MASAGDVDGDGLDDILIGAHRADPSGSVDAGETYLLYGSTLVAEKSGDGMLDLATVNPTEGILIKDIGSSDYSGISVSSAGDVDGDSLDDILVGAYSASFAGETYVLSGAILSAEKTEDGIINISDIWVV